MNILNLQSRFLQHGNPGSTNILIKFTFVHDDQAIETVKSLKGLHFVILLSFNVGHFSQEMDVQDLGNCWFELGA